ncbi:MAG: carbamoyltransferase family protein [Candidatus Acidiferrales bacterium]
MYILGINAYHANASAALVADGQLVAAVEEERFNRVKYAAGFPVHAIRYCLAQAGISLKDVDHVAVPRDPWARVGTKLLYSLRMPSFALERIGVMKRFAGVQEELAQAFDLDPKQLRSTFHRIEHHQAHSASAFFVSPFEEAAVLSADGLGDFASTMWSTGSGPRLHVHGSISFPHSLGIYYTALTQYIGFWKFGDEYKVMGLAAYGQPAYLDEFRKMVHPTQSGIGFRLGLQYFSHQRTGPEMTWREADQTPVQGRLFSEFLEKRLGPTRPPNEPVEQRHRDLAATMQAALEDTYLAMLNSLQRQTKQKNLCLAGGVAFNCVANGKIFDRTEFERVYVHPAAGDAGLSVGAAFHVQHQILGAPRKFVMNHASWGPGYSDGEARQALDHRGASGNDIQVQELDENALVRATAQHIAHGRVVGWFQGRQEWGPRALGNRSILADPRRPEMKDILNQRIKHRETFRPFAPSILEESTGEYFERTHPSPFMTFAYAVRPEKRAVIPAPTHVDGTARLQTVNRHANPLYWKLIREFGNQTGVPVLLNTSFNENEPIVLRPEEALDCFLRTKMDVLVMGNFILEKPALQSAAEDRTEVLANRAK